MSDPDARRVIVDTDTAEDDAQALLLCCLTDRLEVEAVTVVAGNVPFDYEVENAKHTLSLAGHEDVPVYEGAREPLLKAFEHAEYVHGEGGLGGELFPETGIESEPGFAPEAIVERARESPGELSLLCIGPLTNLALARAREPDLPDLLDEVWVMGGAVEWGGNVTPAAEYNFWVDPDAAMRVLRAFEVHLVDWGVCVRDGVFGPDTLDRIDAMDTDLAGFFETSTETVRAFTSENQGIDGVTQPDLLAAALFAYPELREVVGTYHVAVDEREGLTRGYSAVDTDGVTDGEPATHVVESADAGTYREVHLSMLAHQNPDRPFE